MEKVKRNYWIKEKCIEAVRKCTYIEEFAINYSGAYKSSVNNGWLSEITINLIRKKRVNNYWDKPLCENEALKYESKTDFFKYSRSAYKSALRNGWLNEICKHMEPKGHMYLRYNYVAEFTDNHVYIGLTYNVTERIKQHFIDTKSSIYKHMNQTNLTPKIIYDDLKDVKLAQAKEIELIEEYRKNGWILLNKCQGGGLGGNQKKWNKDKCLVEAKKYKTRSEFRDSCNGAYKFCLRHGIMNEACQHM